MHIPQHIVVLIEKYLKGNIGDAERAELNNWYQSFPEETALPGLSNDEEAATAQRLEARILDSIEKYKQNFPPHIKRRRNWLYMAAGILVMLLSFSVYRYFYSQDATTPVARLIAPQNRQEGLQPGGDRAVLTLSDGSTIVLDSASNGTLSSQGNIKVLKLDDGKLSYDLQSKSGSVLPATAFNTITTPRGGQYQIVLSDGTKVWLNAASSIRFPVAFAAQERRVFITGEVYFEVAHLSEKPFRVEAPAAEIEVLGTHFNVNAYYDEATVKTTLLEGKVKIRSAGTRSEQVLLPGQQAQVNKEGIISVNQKADTEEAIAWLHGQFQFKSADLQTILRQIARWYDAEIVYNGDVNLHFTGQLPRAEKAEAIFDKLAMTGEVKFKIDDRKIIVSP